MSIIHIYPRDLHTRPEQLKAVYTACLRALREQQLPVAPPAQHRGR